LGFEDKHHIIGISERWVNFLYPVQCHIR
jgi:hypothetical protein